MKSSKVSGHLLLRDSNDKFVSGAEVELRSGAWKVSDEVKKAESVLDFKKVLGYHQTNRAGLGSHSTPEVPSKRSHEYRKLISLIVEEAKENNI